MLAGITLSALVACNNAKDKEAGTTGEANTTGEATTSAEAAPTGGETRTANGPKSYAVSFSPDSAILGKSGEAKVKVMGGTAVALTDPDGKDNGIQLVVKLQATNTTKIGEGSSISVSYADSRLQLDNGTSISAETGTDYLRAQPESSGKIESWTFQVPAGAKPSALNLFLDGTRVSVGIALK